MTGTCSKPKCGCAAEHAAIARNMAASLIEAGPASKGAKAAALVLRALADDIEAIAGTAPPASAQQPALPQPPATPRKAAQYEARAKGYTGDECRDCGSMAMVRNGTCLKCDVCGSTTGCS